MVKTRGDDFRAAVRARPAMYIGDVHDGSGLVHLIWEVLGNSVDQFLAGHCTRIEVAVERDGTVVVTDDGPGMPVHDLGGLPFAQVALTQMHDRATMDGHRPHEHLGMRGVGVAVVNVLSERLQLDTWRDGFHYTQVYVRGQPQAALSKLEQTERHGTRVAFLPDAEIFTDPWLDVGTVAKRMRELAWLNPPLVLRLVDGREHHFQEPRGLHGYFERTRVNRGAIGPLVVDAVCDAVHVQAIAEWTPGKLYGHIDSFANVERTTGDGTHVDGSSERCGGRSARFSRTRCAAVAATRCAAS